MLDNLAGDPRVVPDSNNWTSYWTYPEALNHEWILTWNNETLKTNQTETTGEMIIASRSLLNADRLGNFGGADVEVHVGDVIQPYWQGGENRSMSMSCIACSEGRANPDDQPGQGVFNACKNYTENSHQSEFFDTKDDLSPGTDYTIPSLSHTLALPNETVGLCVLMLGSPQGFGTMDYTIPFPVIEAPREPHYRFNKQAPTGTSDPSIQEPVTTILATATAAPSSKGDVKGIIAGTVVSVVAVVTFLAFAGFWFWRRRRSKMKPTSSESGSLAPAGRSQDIELTHRPVAEGEEVPPAYHEVVRGDAR
ncbi:hypothetical protein BDV96DRAFT_601077 [Lophiotrema nucula]|uniref:Uncharacterized protein n=1 Tax=Lophiotrema nucula TaxID=690887 RepID=A0A6A5Z2D0_9PLEO|nr:hypothetical protein BDV96DRAFT_601077 [Lophiotrema nucula]